MSIATIFHIYIAWNFLLDQPKKSLTYISLINLVKFRYSVESTKFGKKHFDVKISIVKKLEDFFKKLWP